MLTLVFGKQPEFKPAHHQLTLKPYLQNAVEVRVLVSG